MQRNENILSSRTGWACGLQDRRYRGCRPDVSTGLWWCAAQRPGVPGVLGVRDAPQPFRLNYHHQYLMLFTFEFLSSSGTEWYSLVNIEDILTVSRVMVAGSTFPNTVSQVTEELVVRCSALISLPEP